MAETDQNQSMIEDLRKILEELDRMELAIPALKISEAIEMLVEIQSLDQEEDRAVRKLV